VRVCIQRERTRRPPPNHALVTGPSPYVSGPYAVNHDVEIAHTGRSPAYESCVRARARVQPRVRVHPRPVTRRAGSRQPSGGSAGFEPRRKSRRVSEDSFASDRHV
jgi:hypothetical protein